MMRRMLSSSIGRICRRRHITKATPSLATTLFPAFSSRSPTSSANRRSLTDSSQASLAARRPPHRAALQVLSNVDARLISIKMELTSQSGTPRMQHSFRPTFAKRLNFRFAPAFIAIGLIVLLTAGTWPQAPMISAMALIAIGATDLTIERVAALKTSGHWLSLHCLTYGTLYTLFVCAKLGKTDINLTTI